MTLFFATKTINNGIPPSLVSFAIIDEVGRKFKGEINNKFGNDGGHHYQYEQISVSEGGKSFVRRNLIGWLSCYENQIVFYCDKNSPSWLSMSDLLNTIFPDTIGKIVFDIHTLVAFKEIDSTVLMQELKNDIEVKSDTLAAAEHIKEWYRIAVTKFKS